MEHKNLIGIRKRLNENGWKIPDNTYLCLSDYQKHFIELEFMGINSEKYYRKRLNNLGFTKKDSVLDAGCGMGQWSISLSKLNRKIIGADISMERLLVAKDIANIMNVKNAKFIYSSIEKTPFDDESFDAIFCYGVFMFTHMPNVLKEFHRILKKNGRLYVNVNSLGWYLHLLFDRGLKQGQLQILKNTIKMIIKTIIGKKQNVIVSPSNLRKMLKKNNFRLEAIGPEGTLSENGPNVSGPTKYPAKFYGFPAMTEALAYKS